MSERVHKMPAADCYIARETTRRVLRRLELEMVAKRDELGPDDAMGRQCGEWLAELRWALRGGA